MVHFTVDLEIKFRFQSLSYVLSQLPRCKLHAKEFHFVWWILATRGQRISTKQNKYKQTSNLTQLKRGKETFSFEDANQWNVLFLFIFFFKTKLLVWFPFNDTKHLNEFGGTGTPSKLLNESTQSSQNTQQKLSNQKEN